MKAFFTEAEMARLREISEEIYKQPHAWEQAYRDVTSGLQVRTFEDGVMFNGRQFMTEVNTDVMLRALSQLY